MATVDHGLTVDRVLAVAAGKISPVDFPFRLMTNVCSSRVIALPR
jgi:hypothetical protein